VITLFKATEKSQFPKFHIYEYVEQEGIPRFMSSDVDLV